MIFKGCEAPSGDVTVANIFSRGFIVNGLANVFGAVLGYSCEGNGAMTELSLTRPLLDWGEAGLALRGGLGQGRAHSVYTVYYKMLGIKRTPKLEALSIIEKKVLL